jgi:hypothetical protein
MARAPLSEDWDRALAIVAHPYPWAENTGAQFGTRYATAFEVFEF